MRTFKNFKLAPVAKPLHFPLEKIEKSKLKKVNKAKAKRQKNYESCHCQPSEKC